LSKTMPVTPFSLSEAFSCPVFASHSFPSTDDDSFSPSLFFSEPLPFLGQNAGLLSCWGISFASILLPFRIKETPSFLNWLRSFFFPYQKVEDPSAFSLYLMLPPLKSFFPPFQIISLEMVNGAGNVPFWPGEFFLARQLFPSRFNGRLFFPLPKWSPFFLLWSLSPAADARKALFFPLGRVPI